MSMDTSVSLSMHLVTTDAVEDVPTPPATESHHKKHDKHDKGDSAELVELSAGKEEQNAHHKKGGKGKERAHGLKGMRKGAKDPKR